MAEGAVGPGGRAGLAGAGLGTAMVAIGQSVRPGVVRDVLVYGSPSISVLFGAFIIYIQIEVMGYLGQRALNKLRAKVQPTLDDPEASLAHKTRLRKELEDAERGLVQEQARALRFFRLGR